MALIKKIEKINRNSRVHDEVEATYNIIKSKGGRYIQINTYGSKSRKEIGTVTQTL